MRLSILDFAVIAAYFAIIVAVASFFIGRARRSMLDYFVSHRSTPWWLAGTAMVATTFSADTPLAVTEMVARNGVAGNWLWWSMLASGMMTVFFFARLWRRAEVVTDVELTELRYGGRPAAILRGFRAAYLGLVVNIIIMGWVNLGMAKVLSGTLGINKWAAIAGCLLITFVYTVLAGYWGIAASDGLQYCFEMGGAIVLAVISWRAVGGAPALLQKLGSAHPAGTPPGTLFGNAHDVLAFWPAGGGVWVMPAITLAALVGVNWWASWYPGAEPGGGGYVVQNISATRNEDEGRAAALFFNVAHYAIRSWPWVITALCSLVIYGGAVRVAGVEDPGQNYVRMMVDLLPVGLRGFMLASFAAAYTSTMATQMNWGSSYLMNDLYRRFIRRDASERHYVAASRVAVAITLVLSIVVTIFMDQISHAWEFLMMLGAGTGLVYMLRWYWWRINAWSEVSAMGAALVTSLALRSQIDSGTPRGFALNLIVTTAVTTIVWIAVTFATRPESNETLVAFYRRARPADLGWRRLARETGIRGPNVELTRNALAWLLGVVMVYSIMFATGALIFGERQKLVLFGGLLVVSASGLWATLRPGRRGESSIDA
ncbi:MAG TPA: sodium:solute symporter family protein [Thermoanaerobaculia bacterium]|nr:sodium:solute symporter family protein [Thermoanaerobaculia bacterium]